MKSEKYQLDRPENREFEREIRDGLLNFGRRFPSPGGGAYYLGDDGTPWTERNIETWITCRMAHVYSIGAMLGAAEASLHDSCDREQVCAVGPGLSGEQASTVSPGLSGEQASAMSPGRSKEQAFAMSPGLNGEQVCAAGPGLSEEQAFTVSPGFCRDLASAAIRGLRGELHDDVHGGWYAGRTPDGGIVPDKQCYAHAFVMLAASSAKLAGISGAEELLADALTVFDRYFWDEEMGLTRDTWDTDFAVLDAYRGINANMHMVEAFLAVADATGDEAYRRRAGRIIDHVIGWAGENEWRIPEHFSDKWEPQMELNRDRPEDQFKPYGATPGHGIEWARLVTQWAVSTYGAAGNDAADVKREGPRDTAADAKCEEPRDTTTDAKREESRDTAADAKCEEPRDTAADAKREGPRDTAADANHKLSQYLAAAEHLYRRAVDDAWNADGAPGLVYTTDWSGIPVVHDRMHWTLAEAINTSAVLYRVTGKKEYADDYAMFCEYLDECVLDHENGSWFHQLDRDNRVIGTVWPGKSDLYHAFQSTLIPCLPVEVSVASAVSRMK